MMKKKSLWKTTIIIWSDEDMQDAELTDLANDAMSGDSICTKQETVFVQDSEADPDCAVGEFFDNPDDDDDDLCDQCMMSGRQIARTEDGKTICVECDDSDNEGSATNGR